MKICVLASGSKGNSTYIEENNIKILFDIGKNTKYIKEKLNEINVLPEEINYIVISHLHDDHISALKTFIKKYHTTVCLTQKMFYELEDLKDYDNILIYEDDLNFNGLKIDTIKASHDATDARNFIISYLDKSVVYLTDTGYINRKYFNKLKNKDIYLFESNHDIEMLNNGPYPKWLRQRILGDYGHLSNNAASVYLAKLIGDNTKKIFLMHLSDTNNTEKLALKTIKDTFLEYEINFTDISCAKQNEISEVVNI